MIYRTDEPNFLTLLSSAACAGVLSVGLAWASPAEAQRPSLACETAVHFDFDSSRVNEELEPKLDRLAQCIERSGAEGVYLIGHADRRGHVLYNQELALERARTMRDELRERGVDARIFLSTADESEVDGDRLHVDDRRVDVVLFHDLATVD